MTESWNIGRLLGTSSAYWQGCTLQAAVRLEIFTHLDRDEKSSSQIATTSGSDPRATELLLDALTAMQLLEKEGTVYRNTSISRKLLSKTSPQYMGYIILHHHHLLDAWRQLDRAVQSGSPVKRTSYGEERERESFLMGMFNLAMASAPLIARTIHLKDQKRLLDLGGGPGTFAIHFCMENHNLTAVVYDRPTTEPFIKKTVSSFNLTDRIEFYGGNFHHDPIPGGPFDAAWLSHILHSNSPGQCLDILKKTYEVLEPDGIIMIHDFILSDNRDAPLFGALFSLNMLLNNGEGRSYSRSEIIAMLEEAGFIDISMHDPKTPNESKVLSARKPDSKR